MYLRQAREQLRSLRSMALPIRASAKSAIAAAFIRRSEGIGDTNTSGKRGGMFWAMRVRLVPFDCAFSVRCAFGLWSAFGVSHTCVLKLLPADLYSCIQHVLVDVPDCRGGRRISIIDPVAIAWRRPC